ncbi:MAG: S-layer homology domain-containing protein [Firmicutes bacterium]|nr:S-layer homology domain-containing protein [Bacillota bacterium]
MFRTSLVRRRKTTTSLFFLALLLLQVLYPADLVRGGVLTSLELTVSPGRPAVGETARVRVVVKDVQNLYGIEVHLNYNPRVLRPKAGVTKVTEGDPDLATSSLFHGKQTFVGQNVVDVQKATADYAIALLGEAQGFTGSATVLSIDFEVIASGDTGFWLRGAKLVDNAVRTIDFNASISSPIVSPPSGGGTGGGNPPSAGSPPSGASPPPGGSSTPSGTTPSPGPPKKPVILSDTRGHWAEKAINKLAEMGIVEGHEDGAFRPEEPLTREQLVKLIIVALNLSVRDFKAGTFQDVAADRWSAGYIMAAFERGITEGSIVGTGRVFRPDDPVTRAEMTAMIARARGLQSKAEVPFRDLPPNHWAKDYIKAAYAGQLINGKTPETFDPDGTATRAQAAMIILRMLGIKLEP